MSLPTGCLPAILAATIITTASACGGGGASSNAQPDPDDPPPPIHIELVSLNTAGGQGFTKSYGPNLNSDSGRYITFISDAELVPGNNAGIEHVHIRDAIAGTTTLASVDDEGTPADDNPISITGYESSISHAGNWIAFDSIATNLTAQPTGGFRQIYLHDAIVGTTIMLSVNTAGEPANGDCYEPRIDWGGTYIAFRSAATNLAPNDTNGADDIFLRNLYFSTTTLVSRRPDGFSGNGPSREPSISAAGTHIAFVSEASDLVVGDTNELTDVFRWARATPAATQLVNRTHDGEIPGPGAIGASEPSISNDGRYIAFVSPHSLTSPACGSTAFSNIFVRDITLPGTTICVTASHPSMTPSGPDSGGSTAPHISMDGRYVVYQSESLLLDPADTNTTSDIYLTDLLSGTTKRLTVNSHGGQGNADSANPSIDQSGRFITFTSDADNLVEDDENFTQDVFLYDRDP